MSCEDWKQKTSKARNPGRRILSPETVKLEMGSKCSVRTCGKGRYFCDYGFNLYYNAVKNTPYKWLDLFKFAELMFPRNNILKVIIPAAKYVTLSICTILKV